MGDVINLNRHRKARARSDKRSESARNRATHGISSVERAVARLEEQRARHALERKRREEDPKKGGTPAKG
jgi:hypothetical protein